MRLTTRHYGLLSLRTAVVTVPEPRDYEPEFSIKRRALRSGEGLKRKRIDVIGERDSWRRRLIEPQPESFIRLVHVAEDA